jgi:hypothetical protein
MIAYLQRAHSKGLLCATCEGGVPNGSDFVRRPYGEARETQGAGVTVSFVECFRCALERFGVEVVDERVAPVVVKVPLGEPLGEEIGEAI